ncbi:APC family permease [Amycolatopsis anabasis]|uniref:APC family permease n=1 Tax=Amycolatopsis anabasis TaxID=1840409 RepID=UPI00131CF4F7|nr:APC family permease [Amycolatopsis anabasis]
MNSPSARKQPSPPAPFPEPSARLEGNLGTGGLVLTALALNAPLALMAGFLPVEIGLGLGAATPVVYLVVMLLMLLFAVGVVTMARHLKQPGAFYTYITAGLGRMTGLGAGFVALTGYVLLGAGSYVFTGILTGELVHGFLHGPDLPWWVWAAVVWAVVSALSLFNIDVSTTVLGVFLCVEVVIVLLWDALVFGDGGPQGRGLDLTAQLGSGSVGTALLFGVASLAGFESLQVFRAETRNPLRTIPRASYLTVALLGGFYAVGSWAYLVAFGTDAAVASAAAPAESFLGSLAQYAGTAVRDIANVMLVTSAVASLLAVQNIASRYVFALGRDGVLPAWLGRVHRRHHAPTRAAGTIALAVFVVMVLAAVLRLDPVASYVAMSGLGLWALIALMFVTALAIVVYFRRNRGLENSFWKSRVAPVLAFLGFGFVVAEATMHSDVLMGGSRALATWCVVVVVAIGAGGMVYARWLRQRRPRTWLRIGAQDDPELEPVE